VEFKIVDQFGVPVPNVPVQFIPAGLVYQATRVTDELGIALAVMIAPAQLGEQSFAAVIGGSIFYFDGRVRLGPTISVVQTAGDHTAGRAASAGSYIEIKGAGLAEATQIFSTSYLPVSLSGVSVGFDAPAAGLSLPGHIHFVTPGQVNVQIPWEFRGQSSVQMKVAIGNSQTALITLPLADYAPAFFEYTEPATGQLLAASFDDKYGLMSSANPVERTKVIQFFLNGLGEVDNPQLSGEPTPLQPFAKTRVEPIVTIAGQRAELQFSGLAPGQVGLYQVNVFVPGNISAGPQQVALSIGGVTAKTTTIYVK
jgi:uncharacterized protein (TIGR03437 family)